MRWRTPIVGVAIPLGLFLYTVLVVNVSDFLPDSLLLQTVFYILAGLAWIPPVAMLIGWAQRDVAG